MENLNFHRRKNNRLSNNDFCFSLQSLLFTFETGSLLSQVVPKFGMNVQSYCFYYSSAGIMGVRDTMPGVFGARDPAEGLCVCSPCQLRSIPSPTSEELEMRNKHRDIQVLSGHRLTGDGQIPVV